MTRSFTLAASVMVWGTGLVAQSVVPAKAVRAADSTTTPRLGQQVTVVGRVTLGFGVLDTTEMDIHVQDATGGVFLDTRLAPGATSITEGDSVAVTGTIAAGTGRNRLSNATIVVLDDRRRYVPPTTIAALEASTLASLVGHLVTIEGQVLRAQLGRGDQTLVVSDTTTDGPNIRIFNEDAGNVMLRFDRFSRGDFVRITGVLDQRAVQRNRAVRYTVYPRSAADIVPTALTAKTRSRISRAALAIIPLLVLVVGIARLRQRQAVERKRRAEALRETASRYRLLVDQAPVGIVVHRDGHVLFANGAYATLVGAADPAKLSETCEHLIRDDPWFDGNPHLRSRALIRLRRLDGQVVEAEVTESQITYEGESCVQAVVYDVSDRLRAERALAESEEQLRQAQKLEAIGLLAGGVAHDFNNILTAIKCNATILIDETERSGRGSTEAREIDAATDRAAALTNQLLTFSRRQVVQTRVLELDQLIRTMHDLLRRLLPENVHQLLDLGAPGALVRADPSQLEQVLLNLAVNARDAMPMGGELVMRTSKTVITSESPAQDAGNVIADGAYVILSVTDTGMGMNEDIRPRVFEPFFTTKGIGQGTGLGLSTVYGIVKQHQGHICVESQPGAGTTFHIYLQHVGCALEPAAAGAVPVGSMVEGEVSLLGAH